MTIPKERAKGSPLAYFHTKSGVQSNRIAGLFQLFLGAKLRGVPALLLPAVRGLRRKTGIALAADLLFAVEFPGQCGEGRVVDAAAQPQHKVKRGFLLDVVVG